MKKINLPLEKRELLMLTMSVVSCYYYQFEEDLSIEGLDELDTVLDALDALDPAFNEEYPNKQKLTKELLDKMTALTIQSYVEDRTND